MVQEDILKAIYERRSVREFTGEPISRDFVMEILKAASWAPSGLNNQPWRFAIIWDEETKARLGTFTKYGRIIQSAPVVIPVFLDKGVSYDYVKDCQSIGAALQNLLLAIHAFGLGGVWIGEILKNKEKVREFLGLDSSLELMAVVAMGHPAHRNQKSHRKSIEELIVLEK